MAALESTFAELDGWRETIRTPMEPGRGSALWLDDHWWPRAPLSAIASGKIVACVDHLQAFRVLCEAESFHPVATYTLTRSALLAASEAYWLMAPADAQLRRARGMRYADKGDDEQLKYLRDVAGTPGAYMQLVARSHLALTVRRHGIRLWSAGLPSPGPTDGLGIVRWSAAHLQPDSAHWSAQAVEQWRAGSGNAHGWTYATLTGAPQGARSSGRWGVQDDVRVGGNPVLAWQRYHVPFVTLRAVWRRWAELSS